MQDLAPVQRVVDGTNRVASLVLRIGDDVFGGEDLCGRDSGGCEVGEDLSGRARPRPLGDGGVQRLDIGDNARRCR